MSYYTASKVALISFYDALGTGSKAARGFGFSYLQPRLYVVHCYRAWPIDSEVENYYHRSHTIPELIDIFIDCGTAQRGLRPIRHLRFYGTWHMASRKSVLAPRDERFETRSLLRLAVDTPSGMSHFRSPPSSYRLFPARRLIRYCLEIV
jgi:hypothetical protein